MKKRYEKKSKCFETVEFYLRKRPVCFVAFHISMGVNLLDKAIYGIWWYYSISNNMEKQMFHRLLIEYNFDSCPKFRKRQTAGSVRGMLGHLLTTFRLFCQKNCIKIHHSTICFIIFKHSKVPFSIKNAIKLPFWNVTRNDILLRYR